MASGGIEQGLADVESLLRSHANIAGSAIYGLNQLEPIIQGQIKAITTEINEASLGNIGKRLLETATRIGKDMDARGIDLKEVNGLLR